MGGGEDWWFGTALVSADIHNRWVLDHTQHQHVHLWCLSLVGLNFTLFHTSRNERRAFHCIACAPRRELESFLELGF